MSIVAHSEAGIEQLLYTETELLPPKSLVENARLKDYAEEYRRSVEDPESFWTAAAQELEWFQPWSEVFEWKYPTFEWFLGGKCNITYNCLDRQVKSGRKNKVAYIWAGEDGTEQQITYGQLLDFVGRTANGSSHSASRRVTESLSICRCALKAWFPCWPVPASEPCIRWSMPASA
jgi:hypothetical protein